jgi:hypothetical protein
MPSCCVSVCDNTVWEAALPAHPGVPQKVKVRVRALCLSLPLSSLFLSL